MRVFGLNREFQRAAKQGLVELSVKERDRLRALELWRETGDIRLACRTFGMSRSALYRWSERYDPHDLSSLREYCRRPHRLRRPNWPDALKRAVKQWRERYPRWGKRKLTLLLRSEGFSASEATVGRMIGWLRRRGELVEPKGKAISAKRRHPKRPYATRKPKEYRVVRPGDLVQLDTLDIRPVPGVVLKQFTARDVLSRWDVLEVHHQASSSVAAKFIDSVEARMPFPLRAFQVDGGSEFYSVFEAECQRRGIRLFVLPPKSPKLNGSVERANRTHTEEFYEVYDIHWTVENINPQLRKWEQVYNCIRPHQALNDLTPLQYLQRLGIVTKNYPSPSHM